VSSLNVVAPAFIEMAHRTIYATLATIDRRGRPAAASSTPTGPGRQVDDRVGRDKPNSVKRDNLKRNRTCR